ncbi:hypothetical protein [Bradyrhizobium elkanii]|uniref:hypothetical protein n=1 Tax=Bradyrhizobium elkanii TaxID=29448 RepID=UPI0012FDA619|nr:hypothetical protein [Bradyrhizobium elkanii]
MLAELASKPLRSGGTRGRRRAQEGDRARRAIPAERKRSSPMNSHNFEQAIADAARIIDQYAFGKNPNATMIRRQQIAMRKAVNILTPQRALIGELLDELVEAHRQINQFMAVASTLSDNFQTQLGPSVARRADLLTRHGRLPDDER